MDIKQFISEAIDGGWEVKNNVTFARMLLDPLAWQAVGKFSGWGRYYNYEIRDAENEDEWQGNYQEWQFRMHGFIEQLCKGKTLKEALEIATRYEP